MFFFEKKNQKTFDSFDGFLLQNPLKIPKVFCFFFSKKKAFFLSAVMGRWWAAKQPTLRHPGGVKGTRH